MMKRSFISLSTLILLCLFSWMGLAEETADHHKFDQLKQEFASGPEVTEACLSCHTEAAKQVQDTKHWTWVCPRRQYDSGKVIVMNNFCIALLSNEPRCTSCHVGYGWKDKSFDFDMERNVDCLICHESASNHHPGAYKKFPVAAGHPTYEPKKFGGVTWNPPDLSHVAQSVHTPDRHNCGTCHFFGGGGDGVKHGDMDTSLLNPDRELDVHMDANNPVTNFACVECHKTDKHNIGGGCSSRMPELPGNIAPRVACDNCHSLTPHAGEHAKKLNDHIDKVACQTCHIPAFARKLPTKLSWDWSKAGRLDENGKPIVEKDENGIVVYHAKKGAFEWGKNVIPDYLWWNHTGSRTLLTDKLDDKMNENGEVEINKPYGTYEDSDSRIYPFKLHRGVQPYDVVNKTFVIPKLFGPKESGAYWANYDWNMSITAGMKYAELEYSGEYGFIKSVMYWPQNHMVAPADQALACTDCHIREGSRLENLTGFYMPARDRSVILDYFGWILVSLSLIGVFGHGLSRIIFGRKK